MYDVIFLNADLETEYRCKTIDYLWDSKLYEPGEFQIQILTDSDLDLNVCKYVITNTKKEIGVIEKWQFTSDSRNTVLISGFFAEQLLFKSVIYPTYDAYNKTIWTIAQEICIKYLNDLGFELILPSQPQDGVIVEGSTGITFQQTGDYVGTALYGLAATYGYGVAITKAETKLKIDIFNYHDRTGGTDDDEVVFSVSLNNIKKYDVVKDKSNYRNIAVVAGEGEGSARIFEVVDISQNGARKYHLWVDARDLQQEENESISSYRNKLRQRGLEKLAEYVEIDNVEVEIQQEEAEKIGIEYNIGDLVWVVINPYNLVYKMKIIEIEDVYNQGKRSTSLIFGDKIPSSWEKARALFR